MLSLILFLIAGSILVYLSQYNLMLVSVHLGSYVISDVPLFYVIIGSILLGIVLSYMIHLIHAVSTSMAIHGKERELKKNKEEVLELTKQVHQLELENEKLKSTRGRQPKDPDAL